MINESLVAELRKFLTPEQLLLEEPMSSHTTFRIGGPADYLIFPSSLPQLRQIFQLLRAYEVPFLVLGNGSNVLVRDKGIRGAVIKFNQYFSKIRQEGSTLIVESGALLKDVSYFAAEAGLAGLEFAVGIPGSIGGAVFMNAGAYDGEMKNVVSKVRSVSPAGSFSELAVEDLELGYRRSIFHYTGQIICEVELSLTMGNPEEIRAKMNDLTTRRESKQPLEMPSAGSTFKRPKGYFAGTLIDQTGLKGLRVGDAMVSTKHAGFVVNAGHATAADVLALIEEVKKCVYAAHGVKLYPEVRIIGEE
ncbi:MAG TPA: UDP-N-acetylmuramate dehydrogenase [Selenomonas sp.]|nr:UDP-N-acetylmuramate dehydrogenase [Selenomonadaceae bacterium]HCB92720.1 UDP-N-acetylmuramate dehydrogenase [Selenomonas sp.]